MLWIGGSPCAGKSTIADALAGRHGLRLYRCDDAFWEHARIVSAAVQPVFHRVTRLSPEGLWMRPVARMLADAIAIYREEFALILADLLALPGSEPLLAEGAALLPELVAPLLAEPGRAVWITPSPAFQRGHYAQRAWSQEVVRTCSDPQRAFKNWMERDIRFARYVRREAAERGLPALRVDGRQSIPQVIAWASERLALPPGHH